MKLQKLYNEYKKVSAEYEKLDNMLENDWENETLEAEVDEYYDNVYYPTYTNLIEEVVNIVKCNIPTAKRMIESNKFVALMNMTIA